MRLNAFFTILPSILTGIKAAMPPVKVSLRSSWPAPPFLIELVETIALDEPDAFFPLLDTLTDTDAQLAHASLSADAIHSRALAAAQARGYLSTPGARATTSASLALHAATPKIEAFYRYYADWQAGRDGASCGSWVDWYGEVVCDVERLAHLDTISENALNATRPKTLPFDHIYPPPSQAVDAPHRAAILYASLSSDNFRPLHEYLFRRAGPQIEYVLRYVPPSREQAPGSTLSGYGVALDLKKMDYLAVDDRMARASARDESDTVEGREGLIVDDPIISLIMAYSGNLTMDASAPLTPEEINDLGLQATQLIADAAQPLPALMRLSQDFPKYATSLARHVTANASVRAAVLANQFHAQPGMNIAWLNGAMVQEKDMDPLALLRLLRKERTVMLSLMSLGLSEQQAFELLTHPEIVSPQHGADMLDGMFDASDRQEGGQAIIWWNDIERDARYGKWSDSIKTLLRPLYPGQFHNLRMNLYNIVLVTDMSQMSSVNFITGPVYNIIHRGFPLTFGIVPSVESEESARMAKLLYHLSKTYGSAETMRFLQLFSQAHMPPRLQSKTVDWAFVENAYNAFSFKPRSDSEADPPGDSATESQSPLSFRDILGLPDSVLDGARAYSARLGLDLASSPRGHVFVNGKYFGMDDEPLRNMQMEVNYQLQYLQEKLYAGELDDEKATRMSMSTYFYDLPSTAPRRNRHVYAGGTTPLRVLNLPDVFARAGLSMSPADFVYPADSAATPLSLYVIADLDVEEGLALVKEALESLGSNSSMRVSFLHNPRHIGDTAERSHVSWLVSHLLSADLMSSASPASLLAAIGVDDPVVPRSEDMDEAAYKRYVKASRLVARELQVSPGKQALILNGRVVGPIGAGEFLAADFKTLETYEMRQRTERVVRALTDVVPEFTNLDRSSQAQLTSMAASVVSAVQLPDPSENGLFDAPAKPRSRTWQLFTSEHTSFAIRNETSALYRFVFLLDPIGEKVQKWSALIGWLSDNPDVSIEVYLNPARHDELPLKRFYRYNLLSSLRFDENGQEIPSDVIFRCLPVEPIYTLAMDVPQAWLVRPREALYDLDNIQLGNLAAEDRLRGVEAMFALDYLIIEGHARDTMTNSPPRGLQLQLTKGDATPVDDTQVVANLGYLQFKAKPGVFRLDIRPGRGREVYTMESVGNEGWDSRTVEAVGDEIALTTFEGLTLYPRLKKRPGMEVEDVLHYTDESTGQPQGVFARLLSRAKSILPGRGLHLARSDDVEINIFTVASGLLYERFVSIMILSVLRNTQSPVKFWFIDNFLSPSFLEFIPHFAEEYGFKYELVTYKWPSWLRAQKEKQRIIWAYKILFLDVLFPMDLKKVIFVDADQIVRADLKELVMLDLQGAPYGYTPMGDDNTEMEGFRFWKTGYWKDFLRGLPYHISALYVVDLVRFRQLAAGDILRGQYQGLSADPNSLANLDQDLPNNLQREVPIFSLHEDWLWCETWCSKDRLHRAKTIDLCQNPLTKEPKLVRARKIPEWEEYDSEISALSRRLAEKGLIHSRFAVADANALAGQGSGSVQSRNDKGPQESSSKEDSQAHDEL